MDAEFAEGTHVTICNLGPKYGIKTFHGIVRGVSIDWGLDPATTYIIELVDKFDPEYPYSHCAIPKACLREGW